MAPGTEAPFELIVDRAPVAMVVADAGHRMLIINRCARELFGYARDEIAGLPLDVLIPSLSRKSPDLDQDQVGLRKDGTMLPVRLTIAAVHSQDEDLNIVSIVEVAHLRRAEAAQQRMEALVESAEDAIISKTLDGIIRTWNPAAEKMLGYRAADIIGRSVTVLLPPDRLDEESRILERIRGGERVADFETVRRRHDGGLVEVSLTISPIRDRTGAIVGASKIMRDIAERRRSQLELSRLNGELQSLLRERTAELQEREAMLQEIHHRVKNNLQVVSSLISMQVRKVIDAPTQLALLQCQSRVSTMSHIHEMLYRATDYSRVPFWKFVRELTSRVLTASGIEPGSISLRFELDELSLGVAQAIPCGLILNELIANSLKHAFVDSAGGEIRVALRRLGDRRLMLSVSDDGIGMPANYDPDGTSSLGVVLVRALAKQLNAVLESVPGPGTTTRIIFSEESPP